MFPHRFTLHRHLDGFDSRALKSVLTSHIRSINYCGSIVYKLTIAHQSVSVYSPHWINSLRMNRYVWWICVFLQLWILTWPIIWLMEKRYEVIQTSWRPYLGHQTSDRIELGEFWAPTVKEAAWRGRCIVLTRLDAKRLQGISTEQLLGICPADS